MYGVMGFIAQNRLKKVYFEKLQMNDIFHKLYIIQQLPLLIPTNTVTITDSWNVIWDKHILVSLKLCLQYLEEWTWSCSNKK